MHHISDVDTWGNPDRNYYVFVAISVLLGFIGFDHFYLRSFGTGTQKLLVNCITLGFWYLWDLIQVFKDGQKIRKDGLNSPLDWIQGIGRGTFTPLPSDSEATEEASEPKQDGGACKPKANANIPQFEAKKSYLIYAFLSVCLGWLGADKFYMGETWQGVAKVLSCFNIFLFLFGWAWVIWDAVHAFFMTDSIMENGISVPMPYSFVFHNKICPSVFKVVPFDPNAPPPKEEKKSGGFGSLLDWLPLPSVPQGFSMREIYRELLAPLMIPPIVKGLKEINNPPAPSMPAVDMPSLSLPENPIAGIVNSASETVNTAKEVLKNGAVNSLHVISDVAKEAEKTVAKMSGGSYTHAQEGGAGAGASGPGPVIAGALTAVVLAGGLKGFYDFIIKQYG